MSSAKAGPLPLTAVTMSRSLVDGVVGDVGGLSDGRREREGVTAESDATQHLLVSAELSARHGPGRNGISLGSRNPKGGGGRN
jgi:hypothetical protein